MPLAHLVGHNAKSGPANISNYRGSQYRNHSLHGSVHDLTNPIDPWRVNNAYKKWWHSSRLSAATCTLAELVIRAQTSSRAMWCAAGARMRARASASAEHQAKLAAAAAGLPARAQNQKERRPKESFLFSRFATIVSSGSISLSFTCILVCGLNPVGRLHAPII